ncbi:MAG TPA: hypothetical protein VIP08_03100, partial [Phenylobacterium sp.]
MRRATIFLVCGLSLLAGGAAAQEKKPADEAEGRAMTSSQVGKSSLEGAITTPLRDINVLKAEAPEVLVRAAANPYARPAKLTCAALRPEIAALDDALGDDFDEAPIRKDGTRATAYGLVSTATGGL